jgi:fructokinase
MRKNAGLLFGAIEAGGTKFVCAVGTGPQDFEATRIPTRSPDDTLAEAAEWFRERGEIQALGIASFGPVDLDRDSPTWGYITSTPKPGWRNFDFAGSVQRSLGVRVAFDTDVNAALLAELQWGAAQGISNALYLTVGTGIGGGAVAQGRFVGGSTHPEMGHIRVPHDRIADPFRGCCPFHQDCLEGLASGPAIAARWGASGEDLSQDHPAWELEAGYLAAGIASLTFVLSPQRVLLGGGVMQRGQVLDLTRERLRGLLGGYTAMPDLLAPALGPDAGVLGALALAKNLLAES